MNDLIFRGNALVIPHALRNEMINRVHYNHLGVNKCLKLAQESIFWPTMNNEIRQIIEECHLCLKYSKSQPAENLKSHEIPYLPWNKVGCDLFELNGKKFLLVVDYYSKYIEIEELYNNTTSSQIIKLLKVMFARHGIPLTVVSDGGPQFTSGEFARFSQEWEFNHIITSPTNAQSNGMAERNVQTAKNIFKKVMEENKDIYLALLLYRNMEVDGAFSPAQILMSRRLRNILPSSYKLLKPEVINTNKYKEFLKDRQNYNSNYYNCQGTKTLKPINKGTSVVVQTKPGGIWTPGTVIERLRDRTYKVKMSTGSILLRNRKFLKPIKFSNSNCSQNSPNTLSPEKEKEKEEVRYFIEIENQQDVNVSEEAEIVNRGNDVNLSLSSESENDLVNEGNSFSNFENELEIIDDSESCTETNDLPNTHEVQSSASALLSNSSKESSCSSYIYVNFNNQSSSRNAEISYTEQEDSIDNRDTDPESSLLNKIKTTSSGRQSKPPQRLDL